MYNVRDYSIPLSIKFQMEKIKGGLLTALTYRTFVLRISCGQMFSLLFLLHSIIFVRNMRPRVVLGSIIPFALLACTPVTLIIICGYFANSRQGLLPFSQKPKAECWNNLGSARMILTIFSEDGDENDTKTKNWSVEERICTGPNEFEINVDKAETFIWERSR